MKIYVCFIIGRCLAIFNKFGIFRDEDYNDDISIYTPVFAHEGHVILRRHNSHDVED